MIGQPLHASSGYSLECIDASPQIRKKNLCVFLLIGSTCDVESLANSERSVSVTQISSTNVHFVINGTWCVTQHASNAKISHVKD